MARLSQKQLQDQKNRKIVLEAIESAKMLCKSRYPHISDITPTEADISELSALYASRSFVKYCAKFETVFNIPHS